MGKHTTNRELRALALRLGAPETASDGLLALEPRILLDAAGVETAHSLADQAFADHVRETLAQPAALAANTPADTAIAGWLCATGPSVSSQANRADLQAQDDQWSCATGPDADDAGLLRDSSSTHILTTEIVFIDGGVENLDQLVAEIAAVPGREIVILDPQADGVAQIASYLENRTGIEAIHIVSHGSAGVLELGNTQLTAISIEGEHADELAAIRSSLTINADILIYGCDFAAGDTGAAAVSALAAATGADIAASIDPTGAANMGGDWELEFEAGNVEIGAIVAAEWDGLLTKSVINPTGGAAADGSDGLRIHVMTNGQLQVQYHGSNQLYEPSLTDDDAVLFNGFYMAVGSTVVGPGTNSNFGGPYSGPANGPGISSTDAVFQELPQTFSGTGTVADPFIVTTSMYYNAGGAAGYDPAIDYLVVIETRYVQPDGYFTQNVTVTPPPTNTQIIKIYHSLDTFLSGGDNGPAFSLPQNLAQTNDTVGDPSLVAVRKDPGGPNDSFVGFAEVQGGREFDHWYSAQYNGAGLYTSGLNNGGDIVNTWNTNAATDNGVAVQFTLGAITSAENFDYLIAFSSEATIDLDSDDSSGATGSAFNVTYPAGSGTTVPIADADAHISNVTGDIQEVRISLTNAQSGDSLTVDVGALPAGVVVVSQTANEIVLGSVGPSQTEATFDLALQALGFTTSSASISARSVDFAITNELGVEGFASATTIGINLPPVASNDSFSVGEDGTLTGNLFADNGSGADTDPESDPFTITAINGAPFTVGVPIATASGTLTITNAATGDFTFVPDPGYSGPASFTYTVTDVEGGTDTATASITVASMNDAPAGTDATLTTAEDVPYTFSAADFGFTDPLDSPQNAMQSVIVQPLAGAGTLTFNNIPVTVATTIPAGQLALLVYLPSLDANGLGLASLQFQVVDDGGTANGGQNTDQSSNTITFNVTPVNDAPVLDLDNDDSSDLTGAGAGSGFEVTYIENATGVAIVDGDFTLSDIDNQISELVITLTDGQIGDTLQFPSSLPGGISASVVPGATLAAPGMMTITLTGTGATTEADWQAALASITFLPSTNDVHNPDPADRHITVQASDALSVTSNLATATIHVVPENDPPTLDLDDDNSGGLNAGNYQATYVENAAAVAISSGVIIADLDDTMLEGMTITLANGEAGDILNIGALPAGVSLVGAAPTGLTGSGTITVQLTGTASLADYQAAIAAITFANSSEDPTAGIRQITVAGTDGEDATPTRTAFITVQAVNDAPFPIDPAGDSDTTADAMPAQSGDDGAALTPFDVTPFFNDFDNPVVSLTYTLDPATTPAWLSLDPSGNIIGTPPSDASQNSNIGTPGVYEITVIATDPGGLTGQTTVSYTITNPAPDAVDDALAAQEGDPATTGNVLAANPAAADFDPDGDAITVTAVDGVPGNVGVPIAGSDGGTFTIAGNGDLTFLDNGDFEDLAVGETRDTTITYTITDADGATDTATITITVTGTNDAPVVVLPITDTSGDDSQIIAPIDVSTAFADADATDTLTYTASGLPAGLTLDTNTGLITGTIDPSASQNGNAGLPTDGVYTIVVTADDGNGGTITDSFTFTVSNPAPTAADDAFTIDEDTTAAPLDVLADNGNGVDADPDGDALSVSQVDGAPGNVGVPVAGTNGGQFTINGDGTLTFDPDGDFESLAAGESSTTTITYQVSDGEGGTSTATVTFTVTGVNDAPMPVTPGDPNPPSDPNGYIPVQTGSDSQAVVPLDVTQYFDDPDLTDTLTVTIDPAQLPPGLTFDGTSISGMLDPNASQGGDDPVGAPGVYLIPVTVTDGNGGSFSTTITWNVTNPPPVAQDDTLTGDEDTVANGNLFADNGNGVDADPDNDVFTVTRVVGSGNEADLAALADGTGVGPATVAGSNGGTFTVNADGSFSFDPGSDFNDLADGESRDTQIVYQIDDGEGGTGTAVVTFTVNGVNDLPTAAADDFTTNEGDGPVVGNVITADNGNGADSDPDFTDVLSVAEVGGDPANVGQPVAGDMGGLFTIGADGTMTFAENGEFEDLAVGETRVTTISYTVDDGNGGQDIATVSVTVTGTNDNPFPVVPGDPNPPADPLDYIPAQFGNDGDTVTPLDLTLYFDDPDATDTLTINVDPADLPPGLTFDGTQITGTLDPDASQGGDPLNPGTYLIPVTVDDGNGGTFTTNVVYTIANLPPVAQDDDVAVDEDTMLTGSVLADNGNGADADTAPDNDPLDVSEVDGDPANIGQPVAGSNGGTFTINTDGTYSFDPGTDFNYLAPGEQASTTIEYQVSDGNGGFDVALVTVVVTGINDIPVIVDPNDPQPDPGNPVPAGDPATVVPVQAISDGQDFSTTPLVDIADYVIDPDATDDPLLVFTTTDPLPTGLTLNPDGTITGTVDPSASQGGPLGDGVYPLVITIDDGNGGIVTLPVTLDVSNLDPAAVDDASVGNEDSQQTGNVLTDPLTGDADTLPDSDALTVTDVNGTPVSAGNPAVVALTHGTLTLAEDGAWTFAPNGTANTLGDGQSVQEVVTYTIDDGNGGTDTATLTLDITGVNDPVQVVDPNDPTTDPTDPSYNPVNPTIIADPLNLIPDVTYNDGDTIVPIPAGDFFGDAESDIITFAATDLPAGLVIDPATGEITGIIDPAASQVGNTSTPGEYLVTITATDPQGNTAETTVTLTISNLSPIAVDDTASATEDENQSGNVLTDALTGDADTPPDSDPLVVTDVNGTPVAAGTPAVLTLTHGTLTLTAGGSWSFAPNATANQLPDGVTVTETVTYTIDDGNGGSDTATLSIDIVGINDPVQVVDPNDPTTDPTDPSYDPVDPTVIADPDNLIPDVAYSDGDTVIPIPAGDYFGDAEAETITFSATDLPQGLAIDPATGEITGSIDPAASQGGNTANPGEYLVTITATDPQGNTATTTVTLTIANLPPVAQDDDVTVDEDTVLTGNVLADNGNGADADTAPDSDPLEVAAVNGDAATVGQPVAGSDGGTFTVNSDGTFSFDPGIDFQDLDDGETRTTSIAYTVSDGNGGVSTAIVEVTVTGSNDGPVVIDPNDPGDPNDPNPPLAPDNVIVDQTGNDAQPLTPLDVSPYFVDVDGEPLTFSLDPATTPAWMVIDPVTGVITGTPPSDASQGGPNGDGVYVITIIATDPDGESVTTTVDFALSNPAPVTVLDIGDQSETAGYDFTTDISTSFDDPDGDTLTYTAAGLPGGLTLDPVTGLISGTIDVDAIPTSPNGDGVYAVTVTADDGQGGTTTMTFVFTVLPPPFVDPGPEPGPQFDDDGDPITPQGDGGQSLIVSTALDQIDPLGLHLGLDISYPITSALAATGFPVSAGQDTGHPITDALARMDALDEASLWLERDAATNPWLGGDDRLAGVGGEALLRTHIVDGVVYLQVISLDGAGAPAIQGANGGQLPNWADRAAGDLLIILPPVGTDRLQVLIDGAPVSIDLRHGIITTDADRQKVAEADMPAERLGGMLQGMRELENNRLLSALGMG